MNCTIDNKALRRMIRAVLPRVAVREKPRMILRACQARLFVDCGGTIAGEEALVLEDGECTVPARRLQQILRTLTEHQNIRLETEGRYLLVEDIRLWCFKLNDQPVAPADLPVFPAGNAPLAGKQNSGSTGRLGGT